MKFNKTNIKKYLLRGGTFILVAAGTLFGAYTLTPNKKVSVSMNDNSDPIEDTYFNKLVSKLSKIASTDTESQDEEVLGLSATLNNFEVTWPTKDGNSMNDIKVEGGLNLLMRNLNDFDFTLDFAANYNNSKLDLAVGYVDQNMYLALQDLKIKSTHTSSTDFLEYIYDLFFNEDNPDGFGIELNLEEFLGETFGGIDLSSLLSNFTLPTTTETEIGKDVVINLAMDDINISIRLDKETLAIKNVDLGTIKIGDVTITGSLVCSTITSVIPFDDPSYPKQRGEFVEAISYIGWVDRVFDLFETRKLGLNLAAQIALDGKNQSSTKLVDLTASINIDASDVLDFTNLRIGQAEDVGRPSDSGYTPSSDKSSSCYNPDGNLEFGVNISLKGQNGEEYANFDLSYFDKVGYLTFNENASNEAVMRAKIDISTVSSIIEKLPDIISSLTPSEETSKKSLNTKKSAQKTDDLLDFITSSTLVSAIKNGQYNGIIDCIKNISNSKDGVNVTLDLSSLGLGENAEVSLGLGSGNSNSNKLIGVDVNNVKMLGMSLDASAENVEYSPEDINHIKEFKDDYDDMAFTSGVVDQVSNILSIKKGYLAIEGSIVDENQEGYSINGAAQFDADDKVGYGSIKLREHNSKIVNSNKYIDHTIDFDINDQTDNPSTRNMLVEYNENLKAKITTETITDIIDLVMDLMNTEDERFTKFEDSLYELLLGGAIGNIISSKDYLQLAKSSYLSNIRQTNGGNTISVTILGASLGMNSDIDIAVNFIEKEGNKNIDSLEVKNLEVSGKTINLKASISDYRDDYVSPVNKANNFMDFSQIRVLLDFGINTTKLNYYHLSASIDLKISTLKALSFDLDFHINVDGKRTKVYGYIPSIPWVTDFLSNDIATTAVSAEFAFEPTEDIGGLFHIVRNEDHLFAADEVNYYQADADGFLDGIIEYLLVDMLNIRSSTVDSFDELTLSEGKAFDSDYSKLFTENGFNYAYNAATGINTWKIGLNLDQIAGNNNLGECNITLNGKDDGESGLFTTAHVDVDLVSIIQLSADITLENPSFSTYSWPSAIENKYNTVLGWYHNLSNSDKANFDANYKNNPLKTWRSIEQKRYF